MVTQAKPCLLAVILLLGGMASAPAQETQTKYRRKSISYLNSVLTTRHVEPLDAADTAYLLKAIRREIEMDRFDYNPLPDALLTQFNSAIRQHSAENLDAVAETLSSQLAPEILRILDYKKEMRALGLLTESERRTFIVEKAKETGLQAEHLMQIMNSAYVYLPALWHVSFSEESGLWDVLFSQESSSHRRVVATVSGALLWFAVKNDEAGSRVEWVATKTATAFGSANLGSSHRSSRSSAARRQAFAEAADLLALNLKIASQEIPDFQLSHPLTDVGLGWVEFDIGAREGLGLDDKFIICEFQEQSTDKIQRRELGLVRVSRVRDNTKGRRDSRARTVMGAGYERGMLALEHPRLPIDLSARLGVLPVSVTAGSLSSAAGGSAPELEFELDSENLIYAGQIWLHYNLANTVGISQLFASVYGEMGGGELSGGKVFNQDDLPAGFYWGLGGGLGKKYYWNRLHLNLETMLGYVNYQFQGRGSNDSDEVAWEWRIQNLGLTLNGTLELALAYDLNLGAGVSYRMFTPQQDYTFTVGGAEVVPQVVGNKPEVDFSGWGFQLYVTYSLPALSLNPLRFLF
jgi:hypothetical protein